jgi:hypothetical protein
VENTVVGSKCTAYESYTIAADWRFGDCANKEVGCIKFSDVMNEIGNGGREKAKARLVGSGQ